MSKKNYNLLIQKLIKENKIIPIEIVDENEKLNLEKDEFLLKIRNYGKDQIGFMCRPTKEKKIPKSFLDWYGDNLDGTQIGTNGTKGTMFIMNEEFRTGWQMNWIREGMSTAWVKCTHPYGFLIEINSQAFSEIIGKIDISQGKITSPLYFEASIKNSKLVTI